MIFKFFAVLMIVMFSYAIVVQFNDPDTVFWIVLYALSVLTTVLALTSVSFSGLYWMVLGVYLASIAWLLPNFAYTSFEAFASFGMDNVQQEMVRELWGMVICAVWAFVLAVRDSGLNPIFTKEERTVHIKEEGLCN